MVMLCGGFVAAASRVGLDRPALTGTAAFVVAWGGGVLFSVLAGAHPLVGVVFGVSTALTLVAVRRGPAIGATGAATLVIGLKEASGSDGSLAVAATLLVLVALAALVSREAPAAEP